MSGGFSAEHAVHTHVPLSHTVATSRQPSATPSPEGDATMHEDENESKGAHVLPCIASRLAACEHSRKAISSRHRALMHVRCC